MPKRRLYVWKTKRKPVRHEHNLIIRRDRARPKRKKKRESLPFEQPPEDYTDSVCLLLRERGGKSHEQFEALVDVDRFEEVIAHDWVLSGEKRLEKKYVVSCSHLAGRKERITRLHRFLMSPPDDRLVDHWNRKPADNRCDNVRICTPLQNSHNTSPPKDHVSKYKGVTRRYLGKGTQWIAAIMVAGDRRMIGVFKEEEFAAYAYNVVAARHRSEFAYQNEVELRDEEKQLVMRVIDDTERAREQRRQWASQPKVPMRKQTHGPVCALDLLSLPDTVID